MVGQVARLGIVPTDDGASAGCAGLHPSSRRICAMSGSGARWRCRCCIQARTLYLVGLSMVQTVPVKPCWRARSCRSSMTTDLASPAACGSVASHSRVAAIAAGFIAP